MVPHPPVQKPATSGTSPRDWIAQTKGFAVPSDRKALIQILNTLVPYVALWVLMLAAVESGLPYWTTLVLAVPAAAFLVRSFILFHDCCHGSLFSSRRINSFLGFITGVLTFTSFADWRRAHAHHHMTAGNLDRRGVGDINTMTLKEYQSSPWWKRLQYRLYRNPVVLFLFGPGILFLIINRFPTAGARKQEVKGVMLTNLAIACLIAVAVLTIGIKSYLLVQLPVILMAATAGVWLFYIQHQFPGVYWAREKEWDKTRVALEGSSFYRLPRVLQWFTGNIGFHHVHHIRPRIPNYNLQSCYDEFPALQSVPPLTLGRSFHCISLNLWDEEKRRLISFRDLPRHK